MRMWMVDPEIMCRQHLLGEHVECHMFVGSINRGISMKGYLQKGQLEVNSLRRRHDALARELERRGMDHKSPLPKMVKPTTALGEVNGATSLKELLRRCPDCRARYGA